MLEHKDYINFSVLLFEKHVYVIDFKKIILKIEIRIYTSNRVSIDNSWHKNLEAKY